MEISAVVLREPGRPVEVERVHLADPKPDEVLVRVAAAGVCHSDARQAAGEVGQGRWPMVLGHEGAGVVAAVGENVRHVVPGDHVAFSFVPSCRTCHQCAAGRFNLCEPAGDAAVAGTLLDGTKRLSLPDGTELQHGLMIACFAEASVVNAASAVPIDRRLPLWQAALLGCGVVTGMGAVRNVAHVAAGDSVCVIGVGGVGLQVVAGSRIAGAAMIIAVDRNPETLRRALRLGATHAVDASEGDPAASVRELTGGGADYAFEVVGRPETIRLAWDAIRPGGTAVVVGLVPTGVEVAVPGIEFLSDKSLRGTYYGSGDSARELPDLARLAVDGELDLAGVVTHTVGLDGVQRALERLRGGDGGRTVVVIDEDLAGIERGALQ